MMKQNDNKRQAGFSLVELAVSITIIGILIAGVIKGQELIGTSRVVSLGSKITSIETANNSFLSLYGELAGDMRRPEEKIPLCASAVGTCRFADAAAGNPARGDSGWGNNNGIINGISNVEASDNSVEGRAFWEHLAAANMFVETQVGVADDADNLWGLTHPRSPFGGGFTVLANPTNVIPGATSADPATTVSIASGNFLRISRSPVVIGTENISLTSALLASSFDRKTDDGAPASGRVLAVGDACTTTNGETYAIGNSGSNCDILVGVK